MTYYELLTCAEMTRADQLTIAGGYPGRDLMERAGQAVCDAVIRHWQVCRVGVLCGPGNNGGDGYVAARLLAAQGWPVRVLALSPRDDLTGDARIHADLWTGEIEPLEPDKVSNTDLIIDALFGAGLNRDLDPKVQHILQQVADAGIPVLAIDVPSGANGDSGQSMGAIRANITVTFFRKKPGHLLYPGRALCGEVILADIGITPAVLNDIKPKAFENRPSLWVHDLPERRTDGHKYGAGHGLIFGFYPMAGAAVLAAAGAARAGAGLTSIAIEERAYPAFARGPAAIMIKLLDDPDSPRKLLADRRITAALIGPGAGVNDQTSTLVLEILAAGKPCVLDADALNTFQSDPDKLFQAVTAPCVMTPHEGEFNRLFGHQGDRLVRARKAAAQSGAVIVLKGPDTVIAHPDGRVAINANAPPILATAGSGDVLAGIICGLMAQGMDAFSAACAGVWLHGAAASAFAGDYPTLPGLIADDLPDLLPGIRRLLKQQYPDQA
jgi:NAD(P)H-hydrate epimerase